MCFQPSGSGTALELWYCPLIPRMAVKLSLVDLNQKSECTLFVFFFFPPHYYLLEIGQLTLMTFQLAVVWEYQVLLHKSSSSLSKLVDLVSDYWYKLEEAQICLWHPSWANFSAIVKVCKGISSLFLKWIPSLYLTEFEIFQNLFSRAQYDIGQKNCCLEVAGFSPWL